MNFSILLLSFFIKILSKEITNELEIPHSIYYTKYNAINENTSVNCGITQMYLDDTYIFFQLNQFQNSNQSFNGYFEHTNFQNMSIQKNNDNQDNISFLFQTQGLITNESQTDQLIDFNQYDKQIMNLITIDFQILKTQNMQNNNIYYLTIQTQYEDQQCQGSIQINTNNKLTLENEEKQTFFFFIFTTILMILSLISVYFIFSDLESFDTNDYKQYSHLSLFLNLFFSKGLFYIICDSNFYVVSDYGYIYVLTPILLFLFFFFQYIKLPMFLMARQYMERMLNQQEMKKKLIIYGICIILLLLTQSIFLNLFPILLEVQCYIYPIIIWIQITHNVKRRVNNVLSIKYIYQLSYQNIFYLYFKGCPNNIGKLTYDWKCCLILILNYFIQIILLYCQQKFGPTCIIPNKFGKKFGYKKKIQQKDISIEDECPICLGLLIQQQQQNDININSQLLENEKIIIAPCKHKFHQECLQTWIKVQQLCPLCREQLPLIE